MIMAAWTQVKMRELASEERRNLGVDDFEALDPRLLAAEYGLPVYALTDFEQTAPAAVAHFSARAGSRWSAALIPVGSARVIIENDTHAEVRRRSTIAHEIAHHLLEHPFGEIMIANDGCQYGDRRLEKQATYLSGQLLIPEPAAKRAAFDNWSNSDVATAFEVSEQFAQMQMYGMREYAKRALARQSRVTSAT
jgi:hypothetical protein